MSIVLGRVFEADPIFNHFHLPGKVEVTIAKDIIFPFTLILVFFDLNKLNIKIKLQFLN